MVYRTTAEWRERGYLICAGERCHSRNRWGTCLFNRNQVRLMDSPRVVHVHHYHY